MEKYDEFEISILKQMLIKGINSKEFEIDADKIDMVAFGLATALKGLEIPFFMENKYTEIEHRLDSLLDILFYGIARK